MFFRSMLAAAVLAFSAAPALAKGCPLVAASITLDLDAGDFDAETRTTAEAMRDEGMALHASGDHADSIARLEEAQALLKEASGG